MIWQQEFDLVVYGGVMKSSLVWLANWASMVSAKPSGFSYWCSLKSFAWGLRNPSWIPWTVSRLASCFLQDLVFSTAIIMEDLQFLFHPVFLQNTARKQIVYIIRVNALRSKIIWTETSPHAQFAHKLDEQKGLNHVKMLLVLFAPRCS